MMEFLDKRWGRFATYALGLLVGAALWEYFGERASRMAAAPLSETIDRFGTLFLSGELPKAVASSMKLYASGFASAIVVAGLLGLLLSRVRYLRVGVENYVMFLYATPMVALVPFITSLFGPYFAAKFVVVFMFGFFPILYNTLEGDAVSSPKWLRSQRHSAQVKLRCGVIF